MRSAPYASSKEERCQGRTKSGRPCFAWRVKGTLFCAKHQEQTEQGYTVYRTPTGGWVRVRFAGPILLGWSVPSGTNPDGSIEWGPELTRDLGKVRRYILSGFYTEEQS